MCSYFFLSLAYGIMMEENGFPWFYSLFASVFVYTGAMQFVLITFLSSGASLITVALTTLLINSRQTFYALTFLDDFNKMGAKKPYMIQTLTDETYAVNLTLEDSVENRRKQMFYIAVLSHAYWYLGSVLGGVMGQLIPFEMKGIDFCMTALFIIIFIDQWEKSKKHFPALIGLAVGFICLLIFGAQAFMLPSLIIVSAILIIVQRVDKNKTNDSDIKEDTV